VIEIEPTTLTTEPGIEAPRAIDSAVPTDALDWAAGSLDEPTSAEADPPGPAGVRRSPSAGPPAPDGLDGIDGATVLRALRALRSGNLRVRLPEGEAGLAGSIAEAFNDIVELNRRTADELGRISRAVGREGRIRHRASIGSAGSWARSETAVNQLVFDLTEPMLEVSRVLDAVARGDLSRRMPSEIDGKPLRGQYKRLADTINTMVDQLNAFASEVTRVAREVGTEGKLGGQATSRASRGSGRT